MTTTPTTPTLELATSLDEFVRRIPGVSALYRSGSFAAKLVAAGAATLNRPEAEPLVLVTEEDGVVSAIATIGVDTGSASASCRAVHDALVAELLRHGIEHPRITITVAQVLG